MSTPSESTVTNLLRRVKEGDADAKWQLFAMLSEEKRFQAAIFSMARKLLSARRSTRRRIGSEDIVQSALHTGWCNVSKFRGESECEFLGWFRQILRTKVDRIARRRSRHLVREDLDPADLAQSVPSWPSLGAIVDRELREDLRQAISGLGMDQRLVIELRLRGLTSLEIGHILGLKPATVRKRESRALEKLKANLGRASGTP